MERFGKKVHTSYNSPGSNNAHYAKNDSCDTVEPSARSIGRFSHSGLHCHAGEHQSWAGQYPEAVN